jgi:16S rRNA (guanine527-N7)-methyltransferase
LLSTLSAVNEKLQETAAWFELDAEQGDALATFVSLLQKHGKRSNLVGTLDADRIVEEFIAESLRLLELLERREDVSRIVDVGSGAGIPGIPLLVAMPWANGVLVEPRMKRSQFLAHATRTLSLAERVGLLRDNWTPDLPLGDSTEEGVTLWCSRAVFPPETWLSRAKKAAKHGDLVAVWTNGAIGDSPIEDSPLGSKTYDFGEDRKRTVALYAAD